MVHKKIDSDNHPSHGLWSAGWTPDMGDQAKGVSAPWVAPILLGG